MRSVQRIVTPPRLPRRDRDAHKANVGRVLVVGGSTGLAGAPALAALGALSAGAGLVEIVVPDSIQATVAGYRPEPMTRGAPTHADGGFARGAVSVVSERLAMYDALVLGPGAGRAPETIEVLRTIAASAARPLVLDADGLFAFAEDLAPLATRAERGATHTTVLTPHEGEAARLLGWTAADVHARRLEAASAIAAAARAIVVLKGRGTWVVSHEGNEARAWQAEAGHPILATGGSGDVLAGVVAALIADAVPDGRDAFEAVVVAVHIHARAGEMLAVDGADRGFLAGQIAAMLPRALREVIA